MNAYSEIRIASFGCKPNFTFYIKTFKGHAIVGMLLIVININSLKLASICLGVNDLSVAIPVKEFLLLTSLFGALYSYL